MLPLLVKAGRYQPWGTWEETSPETSKEVAAKTRAGRWGSRPPNWAEDTGRLRPAPDLTAQKSAGKSGREGVCPGDSRGLVTPIGPNQWQNDVGGGCASPLVASLPARGSGRQ